jgi:hypothetical protein
MLLHLPKIKVLASIMGNMLHINVTTPKISIINRASRGHQQSVTSAKCNSVRKLYTNLLDTSAALASAYKSIQMLPTSPAAWQHQQTKFHSGEVAPSEWTRSVRAVRDTLVADYSAPVVNIMHRVVSRPAIAVSLSLHVLSVSYFKQSLWRCGQL